MIPEEEARVPIHNRGYLYGDGCFETIRIHRGAPFRLDAHFARLRQGLEILRIESGWSMEVLREGTKKVAEANGVAEGLVRITITTGERTTARGNATITSRGLPEVPPRPSLHVSTLARRTSGPLSQCKSIARAAECAGLREAEAEGAFDAILLNEKGRVAETTARNVFIAGDGGLVTPSAREGALPGVTRAAVLDFASTAGIPVKEGPLSLERLRSADEVLLTGSGVGVLGIASIDGRRYEAPGPMTERVRTGYLATLDRESRW